MSTPLKLHWDFVVVTLLLLVLGGGGVFVLRSSIEKSQQQLQRGRNIDEVVNVSGWQTYRNEEFGFEVKYPADWKSVENTRQGFSVVFSVFFGPVNRVYKLWELPLLGIASVFVRHDSFPEDLESYSGELQDITVNTINAKQVEDTLISEGDRITYTKIFVPFPDNSGYITFSNSIDPLLQSGTLGVSEAQELKGIYKQILSTFRFVGK